MAWIAAGALALCLSTAWAIVARREASRARESLNAVSSELSRIEEQIHKLRATKFAADETLASQILLTAQASPPVVLAELEKTLPNDVRLTRLSLSYGRQLELEMQLAARRPEAYDDFLARLDRATAFRNISPGMESREGAVQATVKARFRSPW